MALPTTDEIINKYKSVYPDVEKLVTAENRFYLKGLEDLTELYTKWNIPATEKAKYTAQYVIASNAQLISTAQQVASQIVLAAYNMPTELASKEAEIKYKEAQTRALQESVIQNTLIKAFSELNSMIGALGAGGLVATTPMLYQSAYTVWKAIDELRRPDGTKLVSGTEWNCAKPQEGKSYDQPLAYVKPDGTTDNATGTVHLWPKGVGLNMRNDPNNPSAAYNTNR